MKRLPVLSRQATDKSQVLKRGELISATKNKKYGCMPRPAFLLLALRIKGHDARAVDVL